MQVSKVISKKDLMVLLNEIYLSNKRKFNIRFPFYNVDLFSVDVDRYEIRDIITQWEFKDAMKKHTPDSNFLRSDMPRYTDFKDCLISSAFLGFSNLDSVGERLIALAETTKSPAWRSKPLYLGLDTNLLYLKFFSGYFPLESKEGDKRIMASDFRITVSDMVRDEIDARIKHKYRPSNISKMKEAFGHAQILSEFYNCSTRKTRIAKRAQNELNFLFADLEAERAEAENFTEDKEERDRIIAKSYSSFEKEHNGEVLLLTADEDMAYHAKNAGLLAETLIIPHKMVQRGDIEPSRLVNLLYDLAITFGVIRISGTGVMIFSEWKGKGFEDYKREHLRLVIEEDSQIKEDLGRDLRIANRIDELP